MAAEKVKWADKIRVQIATVKQHGGRVDWEWLYQEGEVKPAQKVEDRRPPAYQETKDLPAKVLERVKKVERYIYD